MFLRCWQYADTSSRVGGIKRVRGGLPAPVPLLSSFFCPLSSVFCLRVFSVFSKPIGFSGFCSVFAGLPPLRPFSRLIFSRSAYSLKESSTLILSTLKAMHSMGDMSSSVESSPSKYRIIFVKTTPRLCMSSCSISSCLRLRRQNLNHSGRPSLFFAIHHTCLSRGLQSGVRSDIMPLSMLSLLKLRPRLPHNSRGDFRFGRSCVVAVKIGNKTVIVDEGLFPAFDMRDPPGLHTSAQGVFGQKASSSDLADRQHLGRFHFIHDLYLRTKLHGFCPCAYNVAKRCQAMTPSLRKKLKQRGKTANRWGATKSASLYQTGAHIAAKDLQFIHKSKAFPSCVLGDKAFNSFNGAALLFLTHASVEFERCAGVFVPQKGLHVFQIGPGLKGQRCRAVPQIMR